MPHTRGLRPEFYRNAAPFMPVDYSKYPPNWKAISLRIRERSGGQCECEGECGLHRTTPGPRRCCERNGQPAVFAKGRIILTVAHQGAPKPDGTPGDQRDKMDVRDENLKALCQRCHLRYDAKEHAENARETRRKKREASEPPLPV